MKRLVVVCANSLSNSCLIWRCNCKWRCWYGLYKYTCLAREHAYPPAGPGEDSRDLTPFFLKYVDLPCKRT